MNKPIFLNRTLLAFGWLLVIAATSLNFFRLQLDSDLLFQHDLITDLLTRHGQWQHWRFTPAPAYLPDTLLNALLYFVFRLPADRLLAVSILQALLVTWAALRLARAVQPALSATGQLAILLLSAGVSLLTAQNQAWLYEIHNNVHIPALLFSLLGLSAVLSYHQRPHIKPLLLLAACLMSGIVSGALIYLVLILPLIVLEACYAWRRRKYITRSIHWPCLLTTLLGSAAGWILSHQVTLHHPLAERLLLNWDRPKAAGLMIGQTLYETLSAPGTLIIAGLMTAAVLWTWRLFWLRSPCFTHPSIPAAAAVFVANTQWLARFTYLSISLTLLGSIVSGGFVDRYGLRYFALAMALVLLLAVILTDARSGETVRLKQSDSNNNRTADHASLAAYQLTGLSLVALGLMGLMSVMIIGTAYIGKQALPGSLQDFRRHGPQHYQELAIAQCLNGLQAQGLPLSIGISDYWHARGVRYQAQQEALIAKMQTGLEDILAFTNDLQYFYWMSSKHWRTYSTDQAYVNFVLVARADTPALPFEFTRRKVVPLLPVGFESYACPQVGFDVLFYKDRRLHTFALSRPLIPPL